MKTALSLVLIPLLAMLIISCENDSDLATGADGSPVTAFRMEPASATITSNTYVNLQVYGGNPPFTYAVSDPDMGTITSTNTHTRTITYRPATPLAGGANTIRITDARRWTAHSVMHHTP